MMFVVEARRILSYHTNLPEEQRPPKSIWHSYKKCEEWIDTHSPFKENKPTRSTGMGIEDWERE